MMRSREPRATRLATLLTRLAFALVRLAARLLPQERDGWARAMSAELHHVDGGYHALVWSIGCLTSSITVRIRAMVVGSFRISRWVLAPELALCFVPLTFGWLDVMFGASGIVHFDMTVVERYFLAEPGGLTALLTIGAQAMLGIVGPIGLLLALRLVVLNRPLRSHALATALVAAAVLIAAVFIANQAILGSIATAWDVAGALILFSMLPAAGILHLLYLGRRSASRAIA